MALAPGVSGPAGRIRQARQCPPQEEGGGRHCKMGQAQKEESIVCQAGGQGASGETSRKRRCPSLCAGRFGRAKVGGIQVRASPEVSGEAVQLGRCVRRGAVGGEADSLRASLRGNREPQKVCDQEGYGPRCILEGAKVTLHPPQTLGVHPGPPCLSVPLGLVSLWPEREEAGRGGAGGLLSLCPASSLPWETLPAVKFGLGRCSEVGRVRLLRSGWTLVGWVREAGRWKVSISVRTRPLSAAMVYLHTHGLPTPGGGIFGHAWGWFWVSHLGGRQD